MTVLCSSICAAYSADNVNKADGFLLYQHVTQFFDNCQLTIMIVTGGDKSFCPPAKRWGTGAWVYDVMFQHVYIGIR